MKSSLRILVIGFSAFTLIFSACNNAPQTKIVSEPKTDSLMLAEGEKVIYQCPMHPEVVSDSADAKCPKCGMDLERVVVKDSVKK